MDIVFSVNNNEEIMIFPVVPPNVEIGENQNNEDFESVSGAMKLIGELGLRTLSISSFWPVNKNYSFVKAGSIADGRKYVEFFQKWRKEKVPFRVILTDKDGKCVLNMACLINSFSYYSDKVGDIQYSLDVEEYRFGG